MSAPQSLELIRPAPADTPPGRAPPQNLDAERSVLGGILLDNDALVDVQAILKPRDFFRDAHRKIYESMLSLAAKNEPIDRVSLKDELTTQGAYEAVGGEEFIDLLDKLVPSAANLAYYATIVQEKSLARRMIEAANVIVIEGYGQAGEVREYVDRAEAMVYSVRSEQTQFAFAWVKDLLGPAFKEVEARYERGTALVGEPSGLSALDKLTCGFRPGQLIIVAARPGVGKTSLGLDIARAIARAGGAVGIFSLEMLKEELVLRLMSSEGRVNSQRLLTGRLITADWDRLALASSKLADMQIHIEDTARTVLEIRGLARRIAKKFSGTPTPLRAIEVDYLQLMRGTGRENSREEVIEHASGELKALAKQLGVPVIAMSQLNRECEKRPDKRPQLSDLRGSGAVEQDADAVIFIYRGEEYGDKDCPAGEADLIIGKQRNGPTGVARVEFAKEFSSFRDCRQPTLGFDEPPPPTEEWGNGAKA